MTAKKLFAALKKCRQLEIEKSKIPRPRRNKSVYLHKPQTILKNIGILKTIVKCSAKPLLC